MPALPPLKPKFAGEKKQETGYAPIAVKMYQAHLTFAGTASNLLTQRDNSLLFCPRVALETSRKNQLEPDISIWPCHTSSFETTSEQFDVRSKNDS